VKNVVILIITGAVLISAMITGNRPAVGSGPQKKIDTDTVADQRQKIPSIGKIQVLNGCGVDGAANIMADFLRSKKFDVKNIGNAPLSNYPATLVVSRRKDSAVARQVAGALGAGPAILIRNGDEMYDVTVFVGTDFHERIR
jgi:hypothetical protein